MNTDNLMKSKVMFLVSALALAALAAFAGAHAYGEEFGYVFVKCGFSSADKVKTRLARPWRAYANVAL